ncbi:hypothetical protein EGK14_06105 [Erwinia sp. 198]|nr:hypothetical protein EGK14_06105 [Erwinia sp. 198]
MPTKLINLAKVNEFSAYLNQSEDKAALYSALANGQAVRVKGVALSPGYRLIRVDGRLFHCLSQNHRELALINDVSEDAAYYNRALI